MNYVEEEKVWYNTTINDFEIYSTNKEELIKNERNYYYSKLINDLKIFENEMLYILPIASVLLIFICI